jgi:hypothetical protein
MPAFSSVVAGIMDAAKVADLVLLMIGDKHLITLSWLTPEPLLNPMLFLMLFSLSMAAGMMDAAKVADLVLLMIDDKPPYHTVLAYA